MFSEKTRPINARPISGHAAAQTDRRARREGGQHVLFQLWRPFTSPIVRETRTKAAREAECKNFALFVSLPSRHEIASNGENDLKVDGRNPQRKAERGGAFGAREPVLASSSSA